jgi:hypothetical protein
MHAWQEFQENLLRNDLQNEDFALGRQRFCQKYTFSPRFLGFCFFLRTFLGS